ncbi:MAG: hypothetical protein ABSH49_15315 [Bryobacteraceae bacterium]
MLATLDLSRLQQGTSAAATTLLKTMIDASTPPSVRVRAAEAICNHAAKAIEIEDIEARLAALELAPQERIAGIFGYVAPGPKMSKNMAGLPI